MSAVLEIKYFNSFVLKKTLNGATQEAMWNGSFGIPESVGGYPRPGDEPLVTGL